MDDDSEVENSKGTKNCVIKRELLFENYKNCLFNDEATLKSQQRFKSKHHKMYTEEVNKTALSSDHDKRLQTFDGIETYSCGTPAVKVCENEMMLVRDFFVKKYVDCSFYSEIILKQ